MIRGIEDEDEEEEEEEEEEDKNGVAMGENGRKNDRWGNEMK